MEITEQEYHLHTDDSDGYCVACDAITRFGDTEPDAEKYPCDECGKNTVCGVEQALLLGHLEIQQEF